MTGSTSYAVPDDPTDPEAAALELIVRLPGQVIEGGASPMLTEVLQHYSSLLHAEGAFAGLSWSDAKAIASAAAFDAVTRGDAADFLRDRARRILDGTDNMPWHNREGSARALNIAAHVIGP